MHYLRLIARRSHLAQKQAQFVRDYLLSLHPNLQIQEIYHATSGDKQDALTPLRAEGGKSLFVSDLETMLLKGHADCAVHSLKDVPADFVPTHLTLAAYLNRVSFYDAFVSFHVPTWQDLEPNAVVGTASLRRAAQILRVRPDIQVRLVRGNVGTRLEKMKSGGYAALILAEAGLSRLGYQIPYVQRLPLDIFLPAVGQGILVVQANREVYDVMNLLTSINDVSCELSARAERHVAGLLGAHCHTALACLAQHDGNEMHLEARVYRHNGVDMVAEKLSGDARQPEKLAEELVEMMLSSGVKELL